MSKIDNDRQDVFAYLRDCRSQVKVSTFLILPSDVIDHNYVVVHDAPPRVVREIVNNFVMVGLGEDRGLVIPLSKETA